MRLTSLAANPDAPSRSPPRATPASPGGELSRKSPTASSPAESVPKTPADRPTPASSRYASPSSNQPPLKLGQRVEVKIVEATSPKDGEPRANNQQYTDDPTETQVNGVRTMNTWQMFREILKLRTPRCGLFSDPSGGPPTFWGPGNVVGPQRPCQNSRTCSSNRIWRTTGYRCGTGPFPQ